MSVVVFSVKGRRCAALLTLAVFVGASAATLIAIRNYHAMRSLLEADPPSALLASPERTGIAGLKPVSFTSRDGLKLSAWYASPTNGAMVIVTHGTNGDRNTMLPELRVLTGAGYGVLAFDWPGLGNSEGTIRWDGQARRALTAAIDWLSAQSEVDSRRIGGLGFSIGGFMMTQVAAQDPRLRAVVLEAPPPSFDDYIHLHCTRWGILSDWPARWAIRDSGLLDTAVEPVKLIDKIAPRPVLILAGSLDHEVSAALVTKLYDAARAPKTLWIVDGAQHGGYIDVAAAEYARRLTDFFAKGLRSPEP
jgi:dipeptidyl aminopeptidase/acylaminoacyl peptidase